MTWTLYLSFLAFAALIVLMPAPDFTVVVKNSLVGGKRAGLLAALGITGSTLVQGTVAAMGLGALLSSAPTLFTAVRWIGAAYLCYLAAQALLAAWRGRYPTDDSPDSPPRIGLRNGIQGFVSNITNPKVLAFYLSVLPQFLADGQETLADVVLLAYSHAVLSLLWLLLVVAFLHRTRAWVQRTRVRRTLDAGTGVALFGFAAVLAGEAAAL